MRFILLSETVDLASKSNDQPNRLQHARPKHVCTYAHTRPGLLGIAAGAKPVDIFRAIGR